MGRAWIAVVLVLALGGCVRAFDTHPAAREGGPPVGDGPLVSDGPLDRAPPPPTDGTSWDLVGPLEAGPDTGAAAPGVLINAATATPFQMGAPAGELCSEPDETLHQVSLTRSFRIARYEVTQAEFQAALGYNPSLTKSCPTCPVERVSWSEAASYCNALSAAAGVTPCYACAGSGSTVSCSEATAFSGAKIYDCPGYRLPTEAEWELAARGGTTTSFYGGDITGCKTAEPSVEPYAWYKLNAQDTTHPVGTKLAGPLGLYDTAGNVWEWTEDFYTNYPGTAVVNPVGPQTSTHRVTRGGAFWDEPTYLRLGSRGVVVQDAHDESIGLRWVRSEIP
jgi:sulfatase modifying factor 1